MAEHKEAVRPLHSRRGFVLLAIVLLVALSGALRVIDLGGNPPELFEDELSGAVSAWSIVTTGHDVERTVLPFMVTRLELKQPLYFLATVPFQAVFGHSATAIRAPAVIFGVLTTLLLVWLLVILRLGMRIAFLGGLLFAVTPWAIHYGRAGWEPASYLPFAVAGIGLLWIGVRDHRRATTVAAAGVLALSAYTYHPALLMAVVMALVVVLIQVRSLTRRDLVTLSIGTVLAAIILIPYGLALRDPVFLQRTAGISIFRYGLTFDTAQLAWSNYWAQWTPGFLLDGSAPNPRINPGPLLYLWTVPFLILGLDRALHRRRREDLLLLAWLVLGALPAALTSDSTTPSAARGLLVLPALLGLTAVGLGRVLAWISVRLPRWRTLLVIAAASGAIFSLASFYSTYQNDYVVSSAGWWGYGSGQALRAADSLVPSGGQLCIATNDISGWTFPHQIAYYLPNRSYTITEGIDAPVCKQPGTYLLEFVSRDLGPAVQELVTTPDIHGVPLFRVARVVSDTR